MPPPTGRTPGLALPFPIPDDSVNVPRDIEALARSLDHRIVDHQNTASPFPASPVVGQRVCTYIRANNFRADAGEAAEVMWEWIWFGGAWRFIGGMPLIYRNLGGFAETATGYWRPLNPAIYWPFNMIALVEFGASRVVAPGNTAWMTVGPPGYEGYGAASAIGNPALAITPGNVTLQAGLQANVWISVNAGTVVRVYVAGQAGTAYEVSHTWMKVTPIWSNA